MEFSAESPRWLAKVGWAGGVGAGAKAAAGSGGARGKFGRSTRHTGVFWGKAEEGGLERVGY